MSEPDTSAGAQRRDQARQRAGDPEPSDFVPLPEVIRMTSLSKPVIYRLMRAGEFPLQRQLSPKRVAWVRGEVDAWKSSRPAELAEAA